MICSKPGLADRPQRMRLSLGHFQMLLGKEGLCFQEDETAGQWSGKGNSCSWNSKYISCLSHYFMRESRQGKAENSDGLMADSAQDRNTEQGVNCLTPSLPFPCSCHCFGVFHRVCLTHSPCYPGTDYMAQTGFELVTIFPLPLPDYRSKPPGWAPKPLLVNNTHFPHNQHHPCLGLQKPEVIKMLIIEREKKRNKKHDAQINYF